MKLTPKQVKYLKSLGHHLKPVVTVGKEGVSPGVLKELEVTLNSHELVKVKISAEERQDFLELVACIEERSQATLVQTIGRMALFYRPSPEQGEGKKRKQAKIELPRS